jgi:hypothetical protein
MPGFLRKQVLRLRQLAGNKQGNRLSPNRAALFDDAIVLAGLNLEKMGAAGLSS